VVCAEAVQNLTMETHRPFPAHLEQRIAELSLPRSEAVRAPADPPAGARLNGLFDFDNDVYCRRARRRQPSQPRLAKIRLGNPAPTTGPGTPTGTPSMVMVTVSMRVKLPHSPPGPIFGHHKLLRA
jgi:hypothetical protein